jgi:predicted RND superfamily exporter protein
MFKYISEILRQFSKAQKLTVLIILLLTIVGITYINSITKTPVELTKTVESQRKEMLKDQKYIYNLTQIINSLNDSILDQSQDCDDKAMQREMIYNQKMIEQEKYVSAAIEEVKGMVGSKNKLKKSPILKIEAISVDSILTNDKKKPIEITSQAPNIDNKIIEKLDKIKKNVKKKNK